MEKMSLHPWARGPFELIHHANGHFENGNDFDRRIALIGFDNAIEVCVDVFVNLHPRLRNGYTINKDDKNNAIRNYHTKIEFLDNYIQAQGLDLEVPMEAIIWYHSLRNELYHSGNGMVPEHYVIEGARDAALVVFQALFNVDAAKLLKIKRTGNEDLHTHIPFSAQNPEMDFLRVFVDFERALKGVLQVKSTNRREQGAGTMWRALQDLHDVPPELQGVVEISREIRNQLVHTGVIGLEEDRLVELSAQLTDVVEWIKTLPKKRG
jgi:hypothetical protein